MRLVPVIGLPLGGIGVSLGDIGRRRRPRRRDERRAQKAPQRDQRQARRREAAATVVRAAVDNADLIEELPVVDAEYTDPEDMESDAELGAAYRRSRPARMGRFLIQAPAGVRAAVVELKPGLYIVAEVPEAELQGFQGPINMSRRIVRATKAALENPNKPSSQEEPRRRRRRVRWEDDETDNYGCESCQGRCNRKE